MNQPIDKRAEEAATPWMSDCMRWLEAGPRVVAPTSSGLGWFDVDADERICFDPEQALGTPQEGAFIVFAREGGPEFISVPTDETDFEEALLEARAVDLTKLALCGAISMDAAGAYIVAKSAAGIGRQARILYFEALAEWAVSAAPGTPTAVAADLSRAGHCAASVQRPGEA